MGNVVKLVIGKESVFLYKSKQNLNALLTKKKNGIYVYSITGENCISLREESLPKQNHMYVCIYALYCMFTQFR